MLGASDKAPEIELLTPDGKAYRRNRLTLALFFKTTCPTCQYAWPFYERLHLAYHTAGLNVVGISQHEPERTQAFGIQHGSTFPLLIDEGHKLAHAYAPDFVPTGFLIDSNGQIVATAVAWNREQFEQLGAHIAGQLGVKPKTVISPGESVIEFKPG
ncbi:MAG: TlpA disulfide reductase family protein [Anaerolineae bacterium]